MLKVTAQGFNLKESMKHGLEFLDRERSKTIMQLPAQKMNCRVKFGSSMVGMLLRSNTKIGNSYRAYV